MIYMNPRGLVQYGNPNNFGQAQSQSVQYTLARPKRTSGQEGWTFESTCPYCAGGLKGVIVLVPRAEEVVLMPAPPPQPEKPWYFTRAKK